MKFFWFYKFTGKLYSGLLHINKKEGFPCLSCAFIIIMELFKSSDIKSIRINQEHGVSKILL